MWPNPRFFFVTGGLILIFHTGKGDRKYFPFPLSPPNPLLPLSPFQALFPLLPSYSYEFPSKTLFFSVSKTHFFFGFSLSRVSLSRVSLSLSRVSRFRSVSNGLCRSDSPREKEEMAIWLGSASKGSMTGRCDWSALFTPSAIGRHYLRHLREIWGKCVTDRFAGKP